MQFYPNTSIFHHQFVVREGEQLSFLGFLEEKQDMTERVSIIERKVKEIDCDILRETFGAQKC